MGRRREERTAFSKNPKLSRKWIIVVAVLTALVAGGTVAVALYFKKEDRTPAPSSVPSETPSASPSMNPTSKPSASPSSNPTSKPSASPSSVPSMDPTEGPTVSPTEFPIPEPLFVKAIPVPDNPPKGYFNYDANDTAFGPDSWENVDTSEHPLSEFGNDGWGAWKGHWADKEPTENRCGKKARQQSPKDLYPVDGGNEPALCDAGHEIRSRCGSYPINSDQYQRQILPHKLSLVMNRRPCLNLNNEKCTESQPPLADYPRYSSSLSSHSDLLNFDVKVPAEHTLQGVRYDAEIQMLHTHVDKRRISSIGIPVKAVKSQNGGHNEEFQKVLDEFEKQYNADAAACSSLTAPEPSGNATEPSSNATEPSGNATDASMEPTPAPVPDARRFLRATEGEKRTLQSEKKSIRFNPYSEAFMPDVGFYRYDGSTTEPPCFPLTWWVMMEPMIISFEQLNQIKYLLFTHVDSNCRKTSVHNENQEVVRPIQPLGEDRGIQSCPAGSFETDEEKGRGDGNKCPYRQFEKELYGWTGTGWIAN